MKFLWQVRAGSFVQDQKNIRFPSGCCELSYVLELNRKASGFRQSVTQMHEIRLRGKWSHEPDTVRLSQFGFLLRDAVPYLSYTISFLLSSVPL